MELYYPKAIQNRFGKMKTIGNYRKGHPEGAIVHFTAGALNGDNATRYGVNQGSYCYYVIGPDGTVYQNFPLNRWGYHAGKSSWPSLGSGVSTKLVGIEVVNAGRVTKQSDGTFKPWFNLKLNEDDVRYASARQNVKKGWYHKYTDAQETALVELLQWLKTNAPDIFSFENVLGHDEVAPSRKDDPGGALSITMPEFRRYLKKTAGEVVETDQPEEELPRLRYAPRDYLPDVEKFQKAASQYPGIDLKPDGYGGKNTSDALYILAGYYLRGDARAKNEPNTTPPVPEKPERPVTGSLRLKICRQIVDWEARRDSNGNIQIYTLPSNDGGGKYEVAGINDRYHKETVDKLVSLINAGQYKKAEEAAALHIANYTDKVTDWVKNPGVEAFLRDSAFNRGPTGSARILQIALGVTADGKVGPKTKSAIKILEKDPVDLLQRLRDARESYERRYMGYRANFWKGLVNRWNKAHAFSLSLVRGAKDETELANLKLTEEADLVAKDEETVQEDPQEPPLFPPLSYAPATYSAVAEKSQIFGIQLGYELEDDGMAGESTSDAFKDLTGYFLAHDPRINGGTIEQAEPDEEAAAAPADPADAPPMPPKEEIKIPEEATAHPDEIAAAPETSATTSSAVA
ncbi:MAG: N-acetylmuramoyl-L-alanine amidase [Verrucomicrobiota bacterium]